MRQAVKAGLAFVLWVGLLGVALVSAGRLDLYVILLLVGVLALRELLGAYASRRLTSRLSVFIFAGLLAFLFVVVLRVREALNV